MVDTQLCKRRARPFYTLLLFVFSLYLFTRLHAAQFVFHVEFAGTLIKNTLTRR